MKPEARLQPGRRSLFRWLGWFGMANALVLGAVGLLYMDRFTPPGSALAWVYLFSVYLGHHVMLAVTPVMLLGGVSVIIRPSRRVVTAVAVITMAVVVGVYALDGLLWAQSRFHINALTVQILGWQSWVFAAVMSLIAALFESLLAQRVWRWVEQRPRRHGRQAGLASVLALMTAWAIYAWSEANYYVPVTSLAQRLPVYQGFTAKRLLNRLGLVDLDRARENELAQQVAGDMQVARDSLIEYPLNPLECDNPQPLNLVIILLESWRYDMFSAELTPSMAEFAGQGGQVFLYHYSGGNGSRSGAFSFFYGLPPVYWPSIKADQKPALLVAELARQRYQMGIFSSGTLMSPVELDRSAFATITDLHVSEPAIAPPPERDRIMVQDWLKWLDERDTSSPFFGFLFFDGTSDRELSAEEARLYPPGDNALTRGLAAYKSASHQVDEQVARVLEDLGQRDLLSQTAVIISGDHGEEFDDSHQGFERHGSAFTPWQVRVPLITAWPGRPAAIYDHRTSHYDIVPTLLSGLLGCDNPPADYSVGRDLFAGEGWPWIMVGSYFNYAIMEPDRVTITFPSGAYEIRDPGYRLLPDAAPRSEVLQAVIADNTRFFER